MLMIGGGLNTGSNQHYESPCFSNDQESDEYSFSKTLDQMLDMLNETFNNEEINSKSIFTI